VVWIAASGLHFLRVHEELHAGKPAFVRAGWRDAFLLSGGWSWPRAFDNGFARESRGAPVAIRLPLAPGRGYDLVLRLRPAAGSDQPREVEVLLDGQPAARLRVGVTGEAERFGAYRVRVSPEPVRNGVSRLTLTGGRIEFWYAKLEPQGAASPR
jgi:hypothetical protein